MAALAYLKSVPTYALSILKGSTHVRAQSTLVLARTLKYKRTHARTSTHRPSMVTSLMHTTIFDRELYVTESTDNAVKMLMNELV